MKPSGYSGRKEQWKAASLLASVSAMIITILVVTVLWLHVAGPIGQAIDREDSAQSEMVQKLSKEMRGYE